MSVFTFPIFVLIHFFVQKEFRHVAVVQSLVAFIFYHWFWIIFYWTSYGFDEPANSFLRYGNKCYSWY